MFINQGFESILKTIFRFVSFHCETIVCPLVTLFGRVILMLLIWIPAHVMSLMFARLNLQLIRLISWANPHPPAKSVAAAMVKMRMVFFSTFMNYEL